MFLTCQRTGAPPCASAASRTSISLKRKTPRWRSPTARAQVDSRARRPRGPTADGPGLRWSRDDLTDQLYLVGALEHVFFPNTRPGYVKIAIENGPVEIVDFPSYKMVIFYSYVSLPEGS